MGSAAPGSKRQSSPDVNTCWPVFRQKLSGRCKPDFVTGEAVVFGGEHRLFNPRSDQWDAHFAWSADYLRILPLNEVGDATIQRLNMNDPMLRRQRELLRRAALAGGSPWP